MSYKKQPRDKHGDFITVKEAARRKKNGDFLRRMHLQRKSEKEREAAVAEKQPKLEVSVAEKQPKLEAAVIKKQPKLETVWTEGQPKVEPADLKPQVRLYKMHSLKVK